MDTTNSNDTAVKQSDAGTGLRIERRNTSEVVDVYDMFDWVKSDVIMRNWRDNTVNFEQHGVEFPTHWSENAKSIITSKYFRGSMGTDKREVSLKQVVDRVVNTYAAAAVEHGYMDADNAKIFSDELKYALIDQQFAFNSPVWFNVGVTAKPQVSACFILKVEDTMESILNWYVEEGLIFKGGSGAGVSLSSIRSSKELLSNGGHPSGPVSFMRGADASAGTIKSGGAARRAAKMVVLDVDHPDVLEFVKTKQLEELKIQALRAAGFDMDMAGADINSVQFQNANNSVRVTDDFMNAVKNNRSWNLLSRDGKVVETVSAKNLFDNITEAAWACADPGLQYDNAIQHWHTLPNSGRISASNPCSEYVSLDNSSCNLASIKLTKFYNTETGDFDTEGFAYLARLMIIAMDISICFASSPTVKIGEITKQIRTLGIGFTDLGAMLMAAGAGYDSDLGRRWAASITSLLTSTSYKTSAEIAYATSSFELFDLNKDAMVNVLKMHREAAFKLQQTQVKDDEAVRSGNQNQVIEDSIQNWQMAVHGASNGYMRNAQASVVAPTGTISFFMDADTTGIEPDMGLVKYKKLSDGSSLQIVNQMVPKALSKLGYNQDQINTITNHTLLTGQVLGAPGFNPKHADVFATAMGSNPISADGHLNMMAAVQPFISGAQSKTINLPHDASQEDVAYVYTRAWELGLKAVSIYRDGCKVGQPVSVKGATSDKRERSTHTNEIAKPRRIRLPRTRQAITTSFTVGGGEGYLTLGKYPDGSLGEVFIKMSKQGSTLSGVMDALAMSISVGLQYGVPVETYISKFINSRFEPAGITDDKDIRMASSILDYIAKKLALEFCDEDTRISLGVMSATEKVAALDASGYGQVTSFEADQSEQVLQHQILEADVHANYSVKISDSDAPMCYTCGVKMQRSGSCYVCSSCSETSGCS